MGITTAGLSVIAANMTGSSLLTQICIGTSGLAYASGTYSPIAIVWEIFGLVLLLEMIGLTPTITNAVPYFNTIVIGIIAFGYTLWEYRW